MGKRNAWKNRVLCFMLLFCLPAASLSARSMAAGGEDGWDGTDGRNASLGREAGVFLTPEEEEYLEGIKSRTIVFGIAEASAYTEKDGLAYGTFVPVLNVLEDVFGLEVAVAFCNWADGWDGLFGGELDFLYGIPAGQAEEALADGGLIYSEWLYTNPMYLAAGSEEAAGNKAAGMRLGILEGFRQAEQIIPYLHPAGLVCYATPEEMLQGLRGGQVDALVVAESFQEALFLEDGLEAAEDLSRFAGYTAFATAKEEYAGLVELFDRYFTEGIAPGSIGNGENNGLRHEIQSEKKIFLKNYIMEIEEEAIRAAGEEYETIRYAFSSPDSMPLSYRQSGERMGVFEALLQFAEENTGLSFQEEGALSGADAAAALDENGIQLLVGELRADGQLGSGSLFTPLADTCLVPVVSDAGPFGKEQVGYCYWGVEENYMPLLEGTIFDGRFVAYESKAALLQAYQNGEVGGILLKKGCFDYDSFIAGEGKEKAVGGISIPALEGVAYNGANGSLNALLERLIAIYRLTNREYIEKWKIEEESNIRAILGEYAQQKKELLIWKAAAAGLAGLFLLSVLGRNGGKKKSGKKKQKKAGRPDKENIREESWKQKKRRTAVRPYKGKTASPKESIARKEEKNAVTEEIDSILASAMGISPAREDKKAREGSMEEETMEESGIVHEKKGMAQGKSGMEQEERGVDALTGLIGEYSACKKINGILGQYPQTQAVFSYLDLKKLKQVNHTYGYRTGDEVLVSFGESLKTLELDQNTVVFRADGDKFGAFRGNLQSELDYQLYLGELQSLSAQARGNGKLIYVSYCCSAAVYKKDAKSLKELMKCADDALRFAKKEGLSFAAWEQKERSKKKRRIFTAR